MTTEIANWEKVLGEMAVTACETETHMVPSNPFISVTKQGELMIHETPLVNNEAVVIITDHVIEQAFYPNRFDISTPESPECYAFGRDERGLKPHEAVAQPVSPSCMGCPNYQWGSSKDGGKGKACSTKRRLSMILAGYRGKENKFIPATLDELKVAELYYMRIPTMSIRNFSSYVTKLSITAKRPPFAVYTTIRVNTSKTYNTIEFSCADKVPDEFLPVLLERHKQARQSIMFPYSKNDAQPVAQPQPAAPPQYAPRPAEAPQYAPQPAHVPQAQAPAPGENYSYKF